MDIYVYCDDDGETVYCEANHLLMDACNSQSFMEAELQLQPAETLLIRDHMIDGRRQWRLLSKTQSQFNNAPDVIFVGDRE